MLEQIVDKYDLPDRSKALRCLMDYVEEKEEFKNETKGKIKPCHKQLDPDIIFTYLAKSLLSWIVVKTFHIKIKAKPTE